MGILFPTQYNLAPSYLSSDPGGKYGLGQLLAVKLLDETTIYFHFFQGYFFLFSKGFSYNLQIANIPPVSKWIFIIAAKTSKYTFP